MSFFNLFLYHMCAYGDSKVYHYKGSGHHRYIIALDERLPLTASPFESRE
jgi:hypothetical protein